MVFSFGKKGKTTEEYEEENELLKKQAENEDLQLSILQKQEMKKKLEDAGLSVKKDFGGSVKRAFIWFKNH